jgi:hypothetical protein
VATWNCEALGSKFIAFRLSAILELGQPRIQLVGESVIFMANSRAELLVDTTRGDSDGAYAAMGLGLS